INPSGEMLSGCCIPKEMDTNNIESGLLEESAEIPVDIHSNLRGVVADYVIDNCELAFACDSIYSCSDDSKCVNPSGETLSGCCIPNTMDPNEMEKGLPLSTAEEISETQATGPSGPNNLRGLVSDYVMDHCGVAFACDNTAADCGDGAECINPSGEILSGCCVPKGMSREDLEGVSSSSEATDLGTLNEIDLKSLIAPYVMEYCGPAIACDDIIAKCDDDSSCINPSEGPLAGCCVPKGMKRGDLEGSKPERFEPNTGEFGTLNGIDLKSLIAPYIMENCGPSFACDYIAAHCSPHSSCINPSEGPLSGCCVPKGMTREELETGMLTSKIDKETKEGERESDSICSASVGQCIPRVFAANATKYHEEL
ncbi:hypothetical protein PENTCL1PPCAC_2609, partial [Pristionchus entomophagus]